MTKRGASDMDGLDFFEEKFAAIEKRQPQRMDLLFSALPNRAVEESLYKDMVKFWGDQVKDAAKFGKSKVLLNWDLLNALKWNGSSCCEFSRTLKVLEQQGHVMERGHYTHQALSSRVGRWLWTAVLGEPDELAQGDYVVMAALEEEAENLLNRRMQAMHEPSDQLTTMQLLAKHSPNIIPELQDESAAHSLGEDGLELVLLHLTRAGKCVLDPSPDGDTIIKFQCKRGELGLRITEADHKVLSVVKVHDSITRQIDQLGGKIATETAALSDALKNKNQKRALGHLKQKKMLEGIQQQRMSYQLNLHSILLNINSAHTQNEVMAAYKAGMETMKSVAPNIDDVLDTTAELEDVFANQREIEEAMAGLTDALNPSVDTADLEAELETLVAENSTPGLSIPEISSPKIATPGVSKPSCATGDEEDDEEILLQLKKELSFSCPLGLKEPKVERTPLFA